MKVLVVGGGGREHAIIRKLKESPRRPALYAAPGNGGIASDAVCVPIAATDVAGVVSFAVQEGIDYVVVAPDDPLVLGMVDALAEKGIPAFGPNKAAAILEGSKVFSKNLMKKYGIPTAAYETFADAGEAAAYVRANRKYPLVVKADGLALGKGVLICEDEAAALAAVKSIMEDRQFGASGSRIVIEEFLTGPEVSVLSFTEDVLGDGVWAETFTTRPEPLTPAEKKEWLSKVTGVCLGSDAFFPFGDNIERARRSGVTAIVEPGGSIRDGQVIETCDKYGIVMAFNGIRLFHH